MNMPHMIWNGLVPYSPWYLIQNAVVVRKSLTRQDVVHQLQLEAQASEYARCFCQTQLAGLWHQLQEGLLARGVTFRKSTQQGTCGALLRFSV